MRDDDDSIEKAALVRRRRTIARILKLITESPSGPVIAVVSEFVAAATLAERLSRPGPLDHQAASQFVLAMAEAVAYAGRRLVIHGNLAPEHVLTGDDGQPRITGFALASLDCGPDAS